MENYILKHYPSKKTTTNIGFAKAGAKFPCVEDFRFFSRKKPFRFLFFRKFEKRNWFLLGSVIIRTFSVAKSPPSQSRFPLAEMLTRDSHKRWGFLTKFIKNLKC